MYQVLRAFQIKNRRFKRDDSFNGTDKTQTTALLEKGYIAEASKALAPKKGDK